LISIIVLMLSSDKPSKLGRVASKLVKILVFTFLTMKLTLINFENTSFVVSKDNVPPRKGVSACNHEGTETVVITDPENALEGINVSTDVGSCNGPGSGSKCLIVTIHHTFRAPLDFNIVATDVWDMKRNS